LEHYSLRIGTIISHSINVITGLKTEVEWPNDIILDNKKCAGILIETISRAGQSKPDFVMIGVGLNLNQEVFPDNIKPIAISLRQKTQTVYNRDTFIDTFTKELEACR
jgi:BirA family transcriptional regulator, biotin operon repressor / biotin---[acetyl-CoA-carboxylase] ligase